MRMLTSAVLFTIWCTEAERGGKLDAAGDGSNLVRTPCEMASKGKFLKEHTTFFFFLSEPIL